MVFCSGNRSFWSKVCSCLILAVLWGTLKHSPHSVTKWFQSQTQITPAQVIVKSRIRARHLNLSYISFNIIHLFIITNVSIVFFIVLVQSIVIINQSCRRTNAALLLLDTLVIVSFQFLPLYSLLCSVQSVSAVVCNRQAMKKEIWLGWNHALHLYACGCTHYM